MKTRLFLFSISADGPDREDGRMVMRLLDRSDTTRVETTVLRGRGPYARIASAIDAGGNVAIVALTTAGRIETAVIDPRKPAPRWVELAEGADETRIPSVVATDHDFAAIWLTRHGELLARSFTRTSAATLAAVVATPAQRGEAPPFFVHRDGDNLVFVWQTDDVHRRSLPAALSGYQALVHFRQLICEAPDAIRPR